ncbi:MAG: SRPBCC domain-containing protein [Acidimicrobiales bacterium]
MTETSTTTQVYRVYIKTTARAIFDAITQSEWTERYGYTGLVDYDLQPGKPYVVRPSEPFKAAGEASGYDIPDVVVDGEVVEVDPPHKLVVTFRMLMDADMAAEGFTRLTYEIKETQEGVCSLTLTHELDGAPRLAALVRGDGEDQGAGGGHAWVLSELKTLLETGTAFEG